MAEDTRRYTIMAFVGDHSPADQPWWQCQFVNPTTARRLADRTWDWLVTRYDGQGDGRELMVAVFDIIRDPDGVIPRDSVVYFRGNPSAENFFEQ